MHAQVVIRIQQARNHIKVGNVDRAIALFEQARVLAEHDHAALRIILRQLIAAYRLTSREDRARLLDDQLARLTPGALGNAAEFVPVDDGAHHVRRPSRPMVIGSLFVVGLALIIWLAAGLYYGSSRADTAGNRQEAATATISAEDHQGRPSDVQENSSHGALSSMRPQQTSAAGHRDKPVIAPDELIRDNVGLVLRVAEYVGTLNGGSFQLDRIVSSGTCFAVGAEGVLLTSQAVIEPEDLDTLPPNGASWGMPTLTRRGVRLVVCFERDDAEHYVANVLDVDNSSRSAILKISRRFDHPLPLADSIPGLGTPVRLAGFGELDTILTNNEIVAGAAGRKVVPYANMLSLTAFDRLSEQGIVRNTGRRLGGMTYLEIGTPITTACLGRPLLTDDNKVAGICVGVVPGYESLSLILAIEPIRSQVARHF